MLIAAKVPMVQMWVEHVIVPPISQTERASNLAIYTLCFSTRRMIALLNMQALVTPLAG